MRQQAWFFVARDILHVIWFLLPFFGGYFAAVAAESWNQGDKDPFARQLGVFFFFSGLIANMALVAGYLDGWNVK